MKYTIYLIKCRDDNIKDCYVGRTTRDFFYRKSNHQSQARHQHNDKLLYRTINQYGGIENWQFDILEMGETCDEYLHKEREQYFVNLLQPSLNIYVPNRDIKEYRKDNRLLYNEYMKNYMKRRNLFLKQLQYFNLM